MATDLFRTPESVARKMVASVDQRKYIYVADFAAGDGALLRAARELFPHGKFVATDASTKIARSLRRREPFWRVGTCDFLNRSSRGRCLALSGLKKKVSLILLNPPFSCRGGSFRSIEFGNRTIRCSVALAFLLAALEYLSTDGELVAVLPAGCLDSEKDREAWRTIRSQTSVDLVGMNGLRTFNGCFAKTALVHFRRTENRKPTDSSTGESVPLRLCSAGIPVKIIRGRIQMPTMPDDKAQHGLPFVHSTELRSDTLDLFSRRTTKTANRVSGPAVLVHRVGQPSKSKIALYLSRSPIVLSDCVIALKVQTKADASRLREALLDSWDRWHCGYTGTCAPYVTIERVTRFLRALGFSANIPAAEARHYRGAKNG